MLQRLRAQAPPEAMFSVFTCGEFRGRTDPQRPAEPVVKEKQERMSRTDTAPSGRGNQKQTLWHRRAGAKTGIPISLRVCASAGTYFLKLVLHCKPLFSWAPPFSQECCQSSQGLTSHRHVHGHRLRREESPLVLEATHHNSPRSPSAAVTDSVRHPALWAQAGFQAQSLFWGDSPRWIAAVSPPLSSNLF